MTDLHGSLVHKPQQFQNTPTRLGIYPFETKSSLLIVTLTATQGGSRKLSILDYIQIISRGVRGIEIPEA